jgi:nucleoside-diphosphate-sugar epimerase
MPLYPATAAVAAFLLSRLGPRSPARDRKPHRVLVTGASGFVGRAVIEALAADGYVIRAAVRRSPAAPFPAGVEVVQHLDLTHAINWLPLLKDVDTVVHLAGVESDGGRKQSADYYDRIHRRATARLAKAAAQAGVRHFVYVSSIRAQNGPVADHALTERDDAAPNDAVGRSKLDAEAAVRAAGVPFTILRPVPIYGPGMKGGIARLFRAAMSRWPLPVKDFLNRRSFLGVDNFVSALRFVLVAPAVRGQTYVVADPGIPPALCDVILTLRQAQGRRPLIMRVPKVYFEIALYMTLHGDEWRRLSGNLRVNPAKLIAAGWRPVHDTRAGLAMTVQKIDALAGNVTPLAASPALDRPQPQPG